MNERIVKLFMRSVGTNYIPLPIEDHIPSWTEKFAELIIKECTDICYKRARSAPMGSDEQCEAEDCAWCINKHFGVE